MAHITIGSVLALLSACATTSEGVSDELSTPKVIVIMGDGMDDQQISIARNYLVGSGGRLAMDALQYRGVVKPRSVSEENPAESVHVSGSARAATSMATGILSSGQRISTYPKTGEDAASIMELANEAGIATGVVTTASVTDASPASFMAHAGHRSCQGPLNLQPASGRNARAGYDCSTHRKSRGGSGSIAEQIADGNMDIVLGGGSRFFEQVSEDNAGMSVIAMARNNGFAVITDKEDLQSLPLDSPVLGLFSPELMPPTLRGKDATPSTAVADPFTCEENTEFGNLPRVAQMVESAIRHLEARGSFILFVENEAIDEHSHSRQPCGHIGGVAQIDETVALVMQYAESHPELLVIVTADHGHGAQLISSGAASGQGRNTSPGHVARLVTADGSVMGVNYATAGPNAREGHTGVQVPLLASGPGVNQWPVFVLQTDLFHIFRRHLGLGEALASE